MNQSKLKRSKNEIRDEIIKSGYTVSINGKNVLYPYNGDISNNNREKVRKTFRKNIQHRLKRGVDSIVIKKGVCNINKTYPDKIHSLERLEKELNVLMSKFELECI